MKRYATVLFISAAMLYSFASMNALVGCGLFETGGIKISLPPRSYVFNLNADQARSLLQEYLDGQPAPYNQIDLTGQNEVPAQVCDTANNCVAVPDFTRALVLPIPAQQIDLSQEPDLKEYVSSGKIKSVAIEYIQYDITANSLNFDLPTLDLYMDELDTTTIGENSQQIARVPSISAGEQGGGQVQFTAGGRDIMSSFVLGLKFALLSQAEVVFDTTQSRVIPGGQLAGQITIKLSFTVDPL